MADDENGTLSDLALSTPPNVLSSKSSDISIEELGNEETEQLQESLESSTLDKNDKDPIEISIATESGDTIVDLKDSDVNQCEEKEENLPTSSEAEILDTTETKEKTDCKEPTTDIVKIVDSIHSDNEDVEEDDFDYEDETFLERLSGLGEMFPASMTKTVSAVASGSVHSIKWAYSKGRNLTWLVFSTSALLFLPVMIESERVSFEEMEKAKRQQILLGPSSAMSAGANAPLPPNTV